MLGLEPVQNYYIYLQVFQDFVQVQYTLTCTYPAYNTRKRGWQYTELDRYPFYSERSLLSSNYAQVNGKSR